MSEPATKTHKTQAQIKPISEEQIKTVDFTDYKPTYTTKNPVLGEYKARIYSRFSEEIEQATTINDNVITLNLDKLNISSVEVEDALSQPLQTAEFLQRLGQHQQDEKRQYYVNITGEAPSTEITEKNVGSLISLTGYIEHVTGKQSRKIKVPWFCKSGHCTERIYKRGESIDKPLKCDYVNEDEVECRANPYKQATNREQAIKYGNLAKKPFTAQIQQTVIKIEQDENKESRIKGEWDKPHINKVEEGQTVDIVGILRHEESEEESQEYYIHILGIEDEDKEKELTEQERQEVQEWVNNTTLNQRVMQIDNYKDERYNARLGVLCSVVKGNHGGNNNIHTLLVGPAGTGKTELGQKGVNLIENGEKVEMQKSSKSGIVGSVVRREMLDGENWTVKHGTLARASGGSVLVDEMDKVERAGKINILSETMESQTASIEKVADKTLETDCSIIGTCNPVEEWGREETKVEALPSVFQSHILDRFDLIIWMQKADQSAEDMVSRFTQTEDEGEEQDRRFRKWIQFSQEKNPEFKPGTEGIEQLKNCFERVNSTSNRTETTIANLSQAIAKLNLHDTVKKEDVKEAWNIWTDYKNEMEKKEYGS